MLASTHSKLKQEIEANINLYSTIKMNRKASQESPATSSQEEPGQIDEARKRFLESTNCIELSNPVLLQGTEAIFINTIPDMVPIYGPEGVLFMKTDNPKMLGMMMHMYTETWVYLNVNDLKVNKLSGKPIPKGVIPFQSDPQSKS